MTFFPCRVTEILRSFAPFTDLSEAQLLVLWGQILPIGSFTAVHLWHLILPVFFLPTCIFQSPNRLRYIHTFIHIRLAMLQHSVVTEVLCLGRSIGLIYPGAQAWWSHLTFLSVCFKAIATLFTFHVILLKQGRDCGCYTFPKIKFHKFHVFFSIARRIRGEARLPEALNNLVQGITF